MHLFTGKKGIGGGVGGPRQPVSGILGLIFLALGLIPLLHSLGVIDFTIPLVPTGLILWVLAAIGGLVLLWDALSENMPTGIESQLKMASLIGGLLLLAIGVIPILNNFGVIGLTIPNIGETIINGLFVLVGVLLLYGAAKQF
ncbi:hypothetical protein HYX10_03225 [Candidatus Woesearchaeota archaeon]|nr:hypothetical protein [Candidatus Woesearchaeota archaeon]